jgi:hypothetical protein
MGEIWLFGVLIRRCVRGSGVEVEDLISFEDTSIALCREKYS